MTNTEATTKDRYEAILNRIATGLDVDEINAALDELREMAQGRASYGVDAWATTARMRAHLVESTLYDHNAVWREVLHEAVGEIPSPAYSEARRQAEAAAMAASTTGATYRDAVLAAREAIARVVEPRESNPGYTTWGSVRGGCGHRHEHASGALACSMADNADCGTQGGYSDRQVYSIGLDGYLYHRDGNWLKGSGDAGVRFEEAE